MSQINYGFPREIKQYITSDGEFFDNLEEAKRWQRILNEKAKTSYAVSFSNNNKTQLKNNLKNKNA